MVGLISDMGVCELQSRPKITSSRSDRWLLKTVDREIIQDGTNPMFPFKYITDATNEQLEQATTKSKFEIRCYQRDIKKVKKEDSDNKLAIHVFSRKIYNFQMLVKRIKLTQYARRLQKLPMQELPDFL